MIPFNIFIFFLFHTPADIYEDFESKHRGLDLECVGGGRIEHSPESKKILVYGYSMVSILLYFQIYHTLRITCFGCVCL